jgi:hypothetical protein
VQARRQTDLLSVFFALQTAPDFIGTGYDPVMQLRFLAFGKRPYPLVILKFGFPVNGGGEFRGIAAKTIVIQEFCVPSGGKTLISLDSLFYTFIKSLKRGEVNL